MTKLTAKEFRLRGFGQPVYCCGALPEEDAGDEARSLAVIISHGFASSKNGAMAQLLLKYVLDAGYGCVAYDFPAHGPHKEENGDLTIHGCKANLMLVEEYVLRKVPGAKICYFGSSFGAYITLLHLIDVQRFAAINAPDPEPTAAFLRSAAVDMPDIMAAYDSPEVRELMDRQGYLVSVGGPDEVRMTPRFFEELAENDLIEACRALIAGKHAENADGADADDADADGAEANGVEAGSTEADDAEANGTEAGSAKTNGMEAGSTEADDAEANGTEAGSAAAGSLADTAGALSDALDTPLHMVHATTDEVVDPARARSFAKEFGVPITWFEGEDHTLSTFPETPGKVCDMALRFFRGLPDIG